MAERLIFVPEGGGSPTRQLLGGKAFNLWRLAEGGFQVPPWLAVTSDAFGRFLGQDGLGREIARHLSGLPPDLKGPLAKPVAALQVAILGTRVPAAVEDAVLMAVSAAFAGETFLAVRSSAVGEDTATASYAGQLDSFLFVRGERELLAALKKCWASAFSERILLYRHSQGVPLFERRMGVVIQTMTDGESSGVTFTSDPVSGNRDALVISAVWGAGEGLVSDAVAADSYTYHPGTGEVRGAGVAGGTAGAGAGRPGAEGRRCCWAGKRPPFEPTSPPSPLSSRRATVFPRQVVNALPGISKASRFSRWH